MKAAVRILLSGTILVILSGLLPAQAGYTLVGQWSYKDKRMEISTEFRDDGTFWEELKSPDGSDRYQGRYQLNGQILQLQARGQTIQVTVGFLGADTLVIKYQNGTVIQARRIKAAMVRPAAAPGQSSTASPAQKPGLVVLQRVWEPRERAFSVLVPRGWLTAGGIVNISPQQTNGPGNSITPKCDFTVKSDEQGTVMIRWLPTWNYADLTYSPAGAGLFAPGTYYQGMPVKGVMSPRQFLLELLSRERPGASAIRVVAEDPMTQVSQAFQRQAAGVNDSLRRMGIAPMTISSLAVSVEYEQAGRRYRETLLTSIADNRAGAFQWSNENTIAFRAPADQFESYKPILDMIQTSRQANPDWLASVARNAGIRAKSALETQAYINRVATEIAAGHSRTQAEIRHEQWLFISGQEEYRNPFSGEIERGTSAYRYRWQNNQGDVIYCDENDWDPNRKEEYNTREWKRSPVRER